MYRLAAKGPGEFTRDHLLSVGGEDYVGGIFRAYKTHLKEAGYQRLPSRASFGSLIWILAKLGAITFSRAEEISNETAVWIGQPDIPQGYAPACGMPAPRHYYRIVDPQHLAFSKPQLTYRAARGLEAPPTPRPRIVRTPPPPPPPPVEVVVAPSDVQNQWEDLKTRIQGWTRPRPQDATRFLERFEAEHGIDLRDQLDLLGDYEGLERSDFESTEEFREARAEAWQEFVDRLDEVELEEEEEAEPAAPVRRPRGPRVEREAPARTLQARLEEYARGFIPRIAFLQEHPEEGELAQLEEDMLGFINRVLDAVETTPRPQQEAILAISNRLATAAEEFEVARSALAQGSLTDYSAALERLKGCCRA